MIKSKEKEKPLSHTSYPKLMQSKLSGVIVLFSKDSHGTVIKGATNKGSEVGQAVSSFDMDFFVDYDGTIELANVS